MSEYCDGDAECIYSQDLRKSRTPKDCAACKRAIAPGDYYMHATMVWDGTAESIDRCGACQVTYEHLDGLCDERHRVSRWDSMAPNQWLACGKAYADEWGDEPPADIAALPFLTDREAGALLTKRHALKLAAAAARRGATC